MNRDIPPSDAVNLRWIPVRTYPDVISPWGLFDTAGSAVEWLEDARFNPTQGVYFSRMVEGSSLSGFSALDMDGVELATGIDPAFGCNIGLRLASGVPAPGGVVVSLTSVMVTTSRRRRAR